MEPLDGLNAEDQLSEALEYQNSLRRNMFQEEEEVLAAAGRILDSGRDGSSELGHGGRDGSPVLGTSYGLGRGNGLDERPEVRLGASPGTMPSGVNSSHSLADPTPLLKLVLAVGFLHV